jgi:iron complex transport system ATP-binding protein
VSAAVAKMLVPGLSAVDVVMSARQGDLEPWWHPFTEEDRIRARRLLAAAGFEDIGDRAFAHLSEGERQQVLLARTLMTEPELLLLDEPCAGLDVGGRERLVGRLGRLVAEQATPVVMVTHHVEEIPVGFSHLLLVRAGGVVAAGPIEQVLTGPALSACFGLPLVVQGDDGRYSCRAV